MRGRAGRRAARRLAHEGAQALGAPDVQATALCRAGEPAGL